MVVSSCKKNIVSFFSLSTPPSFQKSFFLGLAGQPPWKKSGDRLEQAFSTLVQELVFLVFKFLFCFFVGSPFCCILLGICLSFWQALRHLVCFGLQLLVSFIQIFTNFFSIPWPQVSHSRPESLKWKVMARVMTTSWALVGSFTRMSTTSWEQASKFTKYLRPCASSCGSSVLVIEITTFFQGGGSNSFLLSMAISNIGKRDF